MIKLEVINIVTLHFFEFNFVKWQNTDFYILLIVILVGIYIRK